MRRFDARLAALFSIAIGVVTFAYRFNQLGGTLGGFENDHFVQLSSARQIVAGDVPFRDYNEIGAPLTTVLSAIGQTIGGYALLPDALLTIGFIALGTAVTCWLASRASGSAGIGLLFALIAAALAPRPYAYPKVILYAVGILAAWRYVDRPSIGRLAALATLVSIAFFFRHDHGLYLGLFALLTVLGVGGLTRASAGRAAALVLLSAAWVVPFLVVIQLNGGAVEYFRKAMVYARRDAERTSFIAPHLEYGSGAPLVQIQPRAAAPPVEVSVRWVAATPADARVARERRYALANPEFREGTTWSYVLADTSSRNIAALVKDPQVEDTHGVDRSRFTVSEPAGSSNQLRDWIDRVQVAPELTNRENALAFLYYLFALLAPTAAVVLALRRRQARAMDERRYVVPVVVLTAVVSVTLMSRGATAIRLPDVAAPMATIAAWLLAVAWARAHSLWNRHSLSGSLAASAIAIPLVVLLVTTAGAAIVLGEVPQRLDTADFDGGVTAAWQRSQQVAQQLRTSPPLRAMGDLDHPGSLRLAEYVRACTGPGDRVFVFGNYPEVYFFAGRPFAGSHVWLVPGFYTSERDQQSIVDRLRRWPVPIVVTEPKAEYEDGYRRSFPLVTAFLDREYRDVGPIAFGDIELRLLIHAATRATGTYRTSAGASLPCFAPSGTVHVAARAQ